MRCAFGQICRLTKRALHIHSMFTAYGVYMAKALRDELTFHISKHKQVLFTQLMTWHVCIVAVKWLIDILL